MASRLTRWTFLTLLAVSAGMVTLLPPGVSPLALLYDELPTSPTNALDAAVRTNREVLDGARWQLRNLRSEEALARYGTRSRTVLVVRTTDDSVHVDPSLTAEAEALWRSVPHHPDAPRAILVVGANLRPDAHARLEPGLCVGELIPFRRWDGTAGSPIRSGAGECLLATEFGAPGRGLEKWLNSIGSFNIPGAVARASAPIRTVRPGNGQWFERDTPAEEYRPWDFLSWWSSTIEEACSSGQRTACVEVLGFGPGGLDSLQRIPRAFSSSRIFAALPAALLADLGPERFGQVWRSDDPLPVAYTRVTGRPFADWALGYVQQRVGRLEKDNALSPAGWIGWGVWMVLLVGWLAVRMLEQPAQ